MKNPSPNEIIKAQSLFRIADYDDLKGELNSKRTASLVTVHSIPFLFNLIFRARIKFLYFVANSFNFHFALKLIYDGNPSPPRSSSAAKLQCS